MRVPKLTEAAVGAHLGSLPGWGRQGEALVKTFAFADFVRAMAFVNLVAEYAERVQHHPDMDIRYRQVTLLWTTHDSGGITRNDLDGARAADALAGEIAA